MSEIKLGRATPVDTNEFDITSVIKEKFEGLKADHSSEIKELINLEVEKAMKKQKEEFKYAIDALQERVTNLGRVHNDLEQYGHCLSVRVEDILVTTNKTADNVLKKVENILKEACPNLSGNVIHWSHRIGSNYKCFKTNNTCRNVNVHFSSLSEQK